MAEVRCGGRLESMRHIRQQAGSCLPGRWDPLTLARGQGRCHERLPAGVIAGLRPLCHKHAVAVGVHRHQAPPARPRVVLRHRAVCAGHGLGHARGCALAGGDPRCVNRTVDLGLRARGGGDQAVQSTPREAETGQAQAARPDCDAHEGEGQHQPVPQSASGTTVQASGHIGTESQGVRPCPPGLQGAAGHLKRLCRWPLGQALGSPRTRVREEGRTFASIPAWLAVIVAWWRVLDDGSHRDLLGPSLALG